MIEHLDTASLWNKLQLQFENQESGLNRTLADIVKRLKAEFDAKNISCTIKKRVKKRSSYYAKLKDAYKSDPSDDQPLTDLLGIRVIVPFLEDIQSAVEELRNSYEILERQDKKESLSFREFSYDSIHLLIPYPGAEDTLEIIHGNQKVIEIQIRTTLQDAWAEVEHQLIYKTPVNPDQIVKRKMASLNANLALSDIIFQEIRDNQKQLLKESQSRMEMVQNKAFESTPKDPFVHNPNAASAKQTNVEDIEDIEDIEDSCNFEILLQKALSSHTNKDYTLALSLYHKSIDKCVDKRGLSIAHHHAGMVYFMLSQYESAISNFDLAVTYNPKNERAFINRGIIHQLKNQLPLAIQDFKIAIELNHDQVDTWLHLANCYLQRYELSDALGAINQAIIIDPQHPRAHSLQLEISEKLIP